MSGPQRPPGGDDCLNLNVWTPDPGAAGLPALVWIHGGSLKFGTGSDALYDGATFARAGVVAVTFNYRLHPAGFLYVGDRPGSGAFGVLDQIAALEWVRENIAAFGGDPDQVTIAGESAGAHSVGQLLAAPAARGLFRRGILQSGAAHFDLPLETAAVIGTEVLGRLGLKPGDELDAIDSAALLAASQAVEREQFSLLTANGLTPGLMSVVSTVTSMPTWGADVLPRQAQDAVANGAAAGIDLLIGSTLDETRLFGPEFVAAAPTVASAAFGCEATTMLDRYRSHTSDGSAATARHRLLTDTLFRIPAIRLAEAARAHHPGVYMYLLGWGAPATERGLGAFHGLDLPFVWDRLDDEVAGPFFGLADRPAAPALAAAMHGAWVEFVRTGVPAHPSLPDWPSYDVTRRPTMWFDDECRRVDDPLAADRLLWADVRY